jgi:two-component system, sensor histidine kinase and response regulator
LVDPKEARINLTELMARVENDRDLLRELLGLFIEEFPGKLEALAKAVASGDLAQVRVLSHALKGALLNMSITQAAGQAAHLEQIAHNGQKEQLREAFAGFERQVKGLLPELQAHLAEAER